MPTAVSERLDKLFVCNECRASFLFQSDILDHKEAMGHDCEYTEVAF